MLVIVFLSNNRRQSTKIVFCNYYYYCPSYVFMYSKPKSLTSICGIRLVENRSNFRRVGELNKCPNDSEKLKVCWLRNIQTGNFVLILFYCISANVYLKHIFLMSKSKNNGLLNKAKLKFIPHICDKLFRKKNSLQSLTKLFRTKCFFYNSQLLFIFTMKLCKS